jgi:hypothetical protein
MIVKCAEADALRSAFPNSLGGMYLEDEIPVTTPKAIAERPKTLSALVSQTIETTATPTESESAKQPTDPPVPDADYTGETVTEEELAVRDKIGELSRQLGMDAETAEREQAAYFKTRGIKDATVSALRAYADSLEGRMERE